MKNRIVIFIVLAITIGPLSNYEVLADRSDFKVNDDYSVSEQNYPKVAVAADGTFVIVWSDRRAGGQDIYLQKYSASGYSLGRNQKVNSDNDIWTHQSESTIAGDISGQYSIVWNDYRNGGYPLNPSVYFQRYDSAVTATGENRNLSESTPGILKESPDISLSPWGGGVVVWADYRNQNWDIYGQRISSLGTTIGENFLINDDHNSYQQHAPKVSVSPDGWFVVVWYDNRNGNDDIMAQIYDSLGIPLGNNFLAGSDDDDARQAFPDVAADGTGHFSVVWVDWVNGQYPYNPDIYYRKFDTTGTAIGSLKKVNGDGTSSTQREVAIAIDRMGHAAIVWADSTNTSWDIMGQMIDVLGFNHEGNYRANADSDSAQQHPDVAVDGRYRYITWADKRNGNYDIYASIQTYNEPQLLTSASALKFDMDVMAEIPPSQSLEITHAGYNPLSFSVIASHDWFSVSPSTGTTTAELTISITTDTLDFGTYLGAITLVDILNQDSSVSVSVRLDVTAPVLDLSADTLEMNAYTGINSDKSRTITVFNSGTGSFNWTATEDNDWLTLSSYSGTDGDLITVTANALSLSTGIHTAVVAFSSQEAHNQSYDLTVIMDVVENIPYIRLSPDSIYASVEYPDIYFAEIGIDNIGIGELNWTAVSTDEWLELTPSSGIAGETITLSLNTAEMIDNIYYGYIDITDSASYTITERLPFILDLNRTQSDTVTLELSVDTINLKAYAWYDEYQYDSLIIFNGGVGEMNWTANENVEWLSLSSYSGADGDVVTVFANALTLSAGSYSEVIIFTSPEAVNQTDSLLVILEVVDNIPYIQLSTDSIYVYLDNPEAFQTDVTINNIGQGEINWTAVSPYDWIELSPISGVAGESITINLNTNSLDNDLYVGYIEITDSASFSITERLPIVLELHIPQPDTISLGILTTHVNSEAILPVELWNGSEVINIALPLKYNPDLIVIDSFVLSPYFAANFDLTTHIDISLGELTAQLDIIQVGDYLMAGHYLMGEIYFTSGSIDTTCMIDTAQYDTLMLSMIDNSGQMLISEFLPGEISITTPTNITTQSDNLLPDKFELHQNYPNPFNATTIIEFDIPEGLHVRLDIFNILGQLVTTLVDRHVPAGTVSTEWNGKYSNGTSVPSGVYFYRLETPYLNRVRKLVLIK